MQASNSYTPRHLAAAHAPLHLACRASATRRALCTAGLAVALSVVAAPGLATELPSDLGADAATRGQDAGYAVAAPVFVAYDEVNRIFYGTAQPGSTVRMTYVVNGVAVEDLLAGEDGSFAFYVPEWFVLSDLSWCVTDGIITPLSAPLTGIDAERTIANRERAEVLGAVGASTSELASGFSTSVANLGVASAVEHPQDTGMPILPYALGAGSALLAVGAVGAVATILRRRPQTAAETQGTPETTYDTNAFAALIPAAPAVAPAAPSGKHRSPHAAPDPEASGEPSLFSGLHCPRPSFESQFGEPADARTPREARSLAFDDDLDELEALAFGFDAASTAKGSGQTPPPPAPRTQDLHDSQPVAIPVRLAAKTPGVPAQAPAGDGPDDDPNPPRGTRPPVEPAHIPADSTAAFMAIAPADLAPASDVASAGPLCVAFASDDDPDSTVPCPKRMPPMDPGEFARTARILATGTGAVHRITASRRDFDLTGLDLVDDLVAPVCASDVSDPLAEDDDWCLTALRELAAPAPAGQRTHSRTIESTCRDVNAPAKKAGAAPVYVAPVVGPSTVSAQQAARRRAFVEEASTPAAATIKSRDEAFREQRRNLASAQAPAADPVPAYLQAAIDAYGPKSAASRQPESQEQRPQLPAFLQQVFESRDVVEPPAPVRKRYYGEMVPAPVPSAPAAVATVTKDGIPIIARGEGSYDETFSPNAPVVPVATATVTKDGVPVIARGGGVPGPAVRARSVRDVVPPYERSLNVPELEQFVPAAQVACASQGLEPSVAAAVGAALTAYADYAPVASRPQAQLAARAPVPEVPASCEPGLSAGVTGSVAAAYAAAVYANVQAPAEPQPELTPRSLPAVVEEPAPESRYDAAYPDTTLSAAYINYLVQEEFAHRHDTPAQRAAALGRMRVVNGAAQNPVSIKDAVNRRRNRA